MREAGRRRIGWRCEKYFVVCQHSRVAWALFICLLLHIMPNVFIYIVR